MKKIQTFCVSMQLCWLGGKSRHVFPYQQSTDSNVRLHKNANLFQNLLASRTHRSSCKLKTSSRINQINNFFFKQLLHIYTATSVQISHKTTSARGKTSKQNPPWRHEKFENSIFAEIFLGRLRNGETAKIKSILK